MPRHKRVDSLFTTGPPLTSRRQFGYGAVGLFDGGFGHGVGGGVGGGDRDVAERLAGAFPMALVLRPIKVLGLRLGLTLLSVRRTR